MKPPVLVPPVIRKRSARIQLDDVSTAENMDELRAIVARIDETSALATLTSIIDAPSEEHLLANGQRVTVNGAMLYFLRQAQEIQSQWTADAQKAGLTPAEISATLAPLRASLNADIVAMVKNLSDGVVRDAEKHIIGWKDGIPFYPKPTDSEAIDELGRKLNLPDAPAHTPGKKGRKAGQTKTIDAGLMDSLTAFLAD